MRRAGGALAAALAALTLSAPAPALAHGLAQREQLPIPQWLFAWGAAAVLVISFFALAVLWPEPRLEGDRSWRPLPGGRIVAGPLVQGLCGLVGVALLAVTIAAGYAGQGVALDNWAPTFILIVFWVGLVFASILFGDVFKAFSPWRALGRVLPSQNKPYPARLGRWPAALGLLGFTWIELVSGWGDHPARLVSAALAYTVWTLAAQVRWGVDNWSRWGESFSVYFNLFSRLSIWETRAGRLGLRRPLTGLPPLDCVAATVPLLVVMIGTVTFDGLSQGELWRSLSADLVDLFGNLGIGPIAASEIAATIGLLACVALIGGFYRLGIEGALSVGGNLSRERLERGFIHSLVPIAAVYVAAHYISFLIFEGQAIGYLASDPFGQGWDLLGTAASGIDYGVFPSKDIWYVQVGFVVLGHVAALTLAHDRALVLYREPRLAVRSQYWMLGVMVGFTSLALWLLAQAGR